MANKNIDDVFASIVKDAKAIAVDTIRGAAVKVQKDVLNEAKGYLSKYYANYTPRSYVRTYSLKNAILPYWKKDDAPGSISIEVGVEYNSGELQGLYTKKSRKRDLSSGTIGTESFITNFKEPNTGLILTNFLKGEHGGAHLDKESTNSLMKKFFDKELPGRINQYVQTELINILINRL